MEAGYVTNFETLQRAAAAGQLGLMECTAASTGKQVIAVCAVALNGGEYTFTPLAKMFDGNPYEELVPPHSEELL